MLKYLLRAVIATLAVLALLIVIGPKITINTEVTPVVLTDDLEFYLAEQEKNVNLTTTDVAKKIVWYDEQQKVRTDLSIIYLHGYSATLMETHPLTENIAKELKANVFYTRLTGHGQTKEEFAKATANNWLQDTLEAWQIGKAIGEKVIIIGTSTGATLATWLVATQQTPEAHAMIFLSPNFYPEDSRADMLLWPWGLQLAELTTGSAYHSWKPKNDAQAQYWVTSPALSSSAHLMALVKMVDSIDLADLDIPTLVFYSELDKVVSIPKIKEKYQELGSPIKKLVRVSNENNPSHHVLAGYIVGNTTTTYVHHSTMLFLIENHLIHN